MPNVITLTSLFAPINTNGAKNGDRRTYKGAIIPSRSDITAEYWGEQLDEADADILLELVNRAIDTPPGKPVMRVSQAEFLRAIGRQHGSANYEWLHNRTMSMAAAAMLITKHSGGEVQYRVGEIEGDDISRLFRFIDGYVLDRKCRVFSYALDYRWPLLFSNEEFGIVDWAQRMAMKRRAIMARALQRLIATSANPPHYRLDMLKELFRYESPMRKFRQSLSGAVTELKHAGVIKEGAILRNRDGIEHLVVRKS